MKFRLYVAGQLPNSLVAIANFRRLCTEPAFAHCELELVDVLSDPSRTLSDGIVATPTLMRIAPGPRVTIFGSLADHDRVRALLELPTFGAEPHV